MGRACPSGWHLLSDAGWTIKVKLGLTLIHNKAHLQHSSHGVSFLGAYLLAYRTYFGLMSHYNCQNLSQSLNK